MPCGFAAERVMRGFTALPASACAMIHFMSPILMFAAAATPEHACYCHAMLRGVLPRDAKDAAL